MFTPSHLAQGLVRVLSPHPIHACARGCFLSVFFLLSFYLLPKSFFHLFLIPAMVPDENSMNDPLCNSAIGSMVSLDYVTPDTLCWLRSPRPFLVGRSPLPCWSGGVSRPCTLGGQPRRERGDRPTKKEKGDRPTKKGEGRPPNQKAEGRPANLHEPRAPPRPTR